MRPQQNRRMRGRGGSNNNQNQNQNRKGPNPLTRNYESNGPDVKIRGSAQQIAEKYTTLARDAQSSGDRVMAENYLQHAEHYNRIIMAALAQMPQQQVRDMRDEDDADEDGDDGFAPAQQSAEPQPQPRQQPRHHEGRVERRNEAQNDGTGPQPVIEGVPAEVALAQQDEAPARQPRAARRQEPRPAPETAKVPAAETPATQTPATQAPAAEAPAEAAVEPAVADAAPAGGEPEEDVAPRRVRRPRRPRVKADEGEQAAGGEASEEIVTEAAQ